MTQEFINQCQRNLIDLTARNALINFKFSSGYSYCESRTESTNQSFEVAIKKPQNSDDLGIKEKLKKLKKIYLKQEEIKSEKGFNPTAFAFGFFKYKDNDQERFAPIYLVPAIVERDGLGGFTASLENGFQDAKFNFAIREKFKEFDVSLTTDLTDVLENSQEELTFEVLNQKIQEIANFLQKNPLGIVVEKNLALSVFNSAKAALYHEMVKHGSDMLNHNLLKNFLQNSNTLLQYFGQSECPKETDKNPSQKFYSPFDFDSSQLQAIKAAKDGKNFVIQGPPGTGKSQTISNIIAELVADGKKVLFVAEKKAAIEAVLKNFSKIGLEKIFLDLHDKKSKSKDIRDQIIDSLEFFQNQGGRTLKTEDFFNRLDQTKSQLAKRTETLHNKTTFEKTAFELIDNLYILQNFENLNCQINTEITTEKFEEIIKILSEIQNYQHIYFEEQNPYLQSDFKKSKDSNFEFLEKNFFGLEGNLKAISDYKKQLENLESVNSKISMQLPSLGFQTNNLGEEDLIKIFNFLVETQNYKHIYFEEQNPYLRSDFKKPTNKDFEFLEKNLLNLEANLKLVFKQKKELKDLEKQRFLIKSELEIFTKSSFFQRLKNLFEIKKIKTNFSKKEKKIECLKFEISRNELEKEKIIFEIENYFEISNEIKSDCQLLAEEINLRKTYLPQIAKTLRYKELRQNLENLGCKDFWQNILLKKADFEFEKNLLEQFSKNFFTIKNLKSLTLEADLAKENALLEIENYFEISAEIKSDYQLLLEEINLRKTYFPKLAESLKYKELKQSLEGFGCADFWRKICSNKVEKRKILDVFKKNFYSNALDKIAKKNDFIANTKDFSALIEDFKNDDRSLIKLNSSRLAQKVKSKNAHLVDDYEILQLKIRQRFGKPRKLISKFKETILDAVSCVACSPLTICEFFEINEDLSPIFDTVIFDEASQIYTWDAISSIFRAKQLIIAGDTKQMPPSNLFSGSNAAEDEEEIDEDNEEQNVNDTVSLLDFAAPKMKELLLNWHYRSKFEELILPSNRFIYNDKLVTFPNSAKQEKPIEFIYLEGGIWEKQTNDLEAKKTIELLQSLYNSGKKSVGVIAINAKQCKLIRDLIETRDDLCAWLEAKDENGLFVKNLENCQGDERDTIIICTSYAKDKDGKISGRMFGQLNKENAEKRLNVMFSRAREKVFLLSSLKSAQIPSQLQGKAIEFLRKYLTYAEIDEWKISANQNFKIDSDNFDSGFEESVCKALRNVGFEVESQVGCSGYKIDLAIICPKTRNYILGIECDGEIYHSGKTARERDRLRQEILEKKGWKIHRIWGYDWLESQNEQIEKIRKLVNL